MAVITNSVTSRKGLGNRSVRLMLTAILILYISTGVYWVTTLCEAFGKQTSLKNRLEYLDSALASFSDALGRNEPWRYEFNTPDWSVRSIQDCGGTAALTVNVYASMSCVVSPLTISLMTSFFRFSSATQSSGGVRGYYGRTIEWSVFSTSHSPSLPLVRYHSC